MLRPEIPFNAPQGWCCPKCGRVYSPQHSQCEPCNKKVKPVYVNKITAKGDE